MAIKWREHFKGLHFASVDGVQLKLQESFMYDDSWFGFIEDDCALAGMQGLDNAKRGLERMFENATDEYRVRWGLKPRGH